MAVSQRPPRRRSGTGEDVVTTGAHGVRAGLGGLRADAQWAIGGRAAGGQRVHGGVAGGRPADGRGGRAGGRADGWARRTRAAEWERVRGGWPADGAAGVAADGRRG